jgi:hypothetical protein
LDHNPGMFDGSIETIFSPLDLSPLGTTSSNSACIEEIILNML